MATVTVKERPFNHEETQRKVRHPLHLLRKYIRRYIILEGVGSRSSFGPFFWFSSHRLRLWLDFDWRSRCVLRNAGTAVSRTQRRLASGAQRLLISRLGQPGIRGIILAAIVLASRSSATTVVAPGSRSSTIRPSLVLERRFPGAAIASSPPSNWPTRNCPRVGYSQALVRDDSGVDRLKQLNRESIQLARLYTLWFYWRIVRRRATHDRGNLRRSRG